MEKIQKGFKIFAIILAIFLGISLILGIFWNIFDDVARILFVVIFANFAVLAIFYYIDLKKRIEEGYKLYLVESYNRGEISKRQLEEFDEARFKNYKKMFRSNKAKIIFLFILFFAISAVSLAISLKFWL